MGDSIDYKYLYCGDKQGNLNIIDIVDKKLYSSFHGHKKAILSITFSPKNDIFCTGSADSTIKIWDKNNTEIIQLKKHSDATSSIAFNPDGSFLVSVGYDKKIYLWNL